LAKELCFVRNSLREAVKLWRERPQEEGDETSDDQEREGVLRLIDPQAGGVASTGRIVVFTDSTVSVFAASKGRSRSPEMQSVVDEIELLLLESGMEAVFKHIPGQAMIRLHVNGASRRNPLPLMRAQDPLQIHPYLVHRWGITPSLRRLVGAAYPNAVFITDWVDLELARLPGITFCLSPRPDTAVPIVMQALEMWTARPHSTTVIVLLARDFGTKGLRALLRQFDQVAPGKRFQRLVADGEDCIWDTMMMVKGPKPCPKFGSVELNAEHARLVQLRKTERGTKVPEGRRQRDSGVPSCAHGGLCELESGQRHVVKTLSRSGARGDGDEPEGAGRAYALGLGTRVEGRGLHTMRVGVRARPRRRRTRPRDIEQEMAALNRDLDELQRHEDERHGDNLNALHALGLRGEGRRKEATMEAREGAKDAKGNALRGRRLTGAKWARKGEVLKCRECGHTDLWTEMFACRYRQQGADTKRFGRPPSCGNTLCPKCLSKGVPEKAHPSREGRAPVELNTSHARVNAGAHVCSHCRWYLCTGRSLDMNEGRGRHIRVGIDHTIPTRHLSPPYSQDYQDIREGSEPAS
jgi:hypothetical protein